VVILITYVTRDEASPLLISHRCKKEKDSTWCCPYLRYGGCDVIASLPLREVVHAALEEGLVLVAGDVLGDI